MSFLLYTSVGLMITICVFLVLLILIQKGRGGGLASAFGGGGGNTAFGSKTGDVLTWATSIVFGIFLILAIVTNLTANSIHRTRIGATAATATPATPAPAAPAIPASENPLNTPSNTDVPIAPAPAPIAPSTTQPTP